MKDLHAFKVFMLCSPARSLETGDELLERAEEQININLVSMSPFKQEHV
jgi:hypothetical protein